MYWFRYDRIGSGLGSGLGSGFLISNSSFLLWEQFSACEFSISSFLAALGTGFHLHFPVLEGDMINPCTSKYVGTAFPVTILIFSRRIEK